MKDFTKPETDFELSLHKLILNNTNISGNLIEGIEKNTLYEKIIEKGEKKGFKVSEELFNYTLELFDKADLIGVKNNKIYIFPLFWALHIN